jgi:hypothetical protein
MEDFQDCKMDAGEGMIKCPKCNGKKVKRYKGWYSDEILWNLICLKADYSFDELNPSMFLIKIICNQCLGSGIYDWCTNTFVNVNGKFSALEGNLDIYNLTAVSDWPFNSTTHVFIGEFWFSQLVYKKPENLIKICQKRYMGIKLNESVLSMRVRELDNLRDKAVAYNKIIRNCPKDDLNEEVIRNTIARLDLFEFMPDKFAYPGPDDFPADK